MWSNGAITDLEASTSGNSGAWTINNHGQVVGNSLGARQRPILWQGGEATEITLPASINAIALGAVGINDAGQVLLKAASPMVTSAPGFGRLAM